MARAGIKNSIKYYLPFVASVKRRLNDAHPLFSYPYGEFFSATNDVRKNIRLGKHPVMLEYPVFPEPRFGWGKPPHQGLYDIINRNRDAYADTIGKFQAFRENYRRIDAQTVPGTGEPHWQNPWFQGLDAMSLYAMPAILGSKNYVEIGSGESTKFVRRSIRDNKLPTKITSIDPFPRVEVEALCDVSIRAPLEKTTFDFSILQSGDILMFDGSHRCFQNSDVTVFFTEILPQINNGVHVFIHDIFLPYDYRPEWQDRWYSEQYLMAVLLQNDMGRRYDITLPCLFVDFDGSLRGDVEQLWRDVDHTFMQPVGATGFWLRVRGV